MRRSISILCPLIIVAIYVSLGFTSTKKTTNVPKNLLVEQPIEATVALRAKEETNFKVTPFVGKTFTGFREALGFKESQGDYFVINRLGYMGKYQFGASTLAMIGIKNIEKFLKSPSLQEKAFIANTARNKWILRRDIKRFVGKKINGVVITESGILAAAHLAGAGNVKKYLRSWGSFSFADGNGTTIRYYMKKFSGYDTSYIQPMKRAKV
jgi:hypothetical protein